MLCLISFGLVSGVFLHHVWEGFWPCVWGIFASCLGHFLHYVWKYFKIMQGRMDGTF